MSRPHKRYSDAAEACYWQSRARFWHDEADRLAKAIEAQPVRLDLRDDWTSTKRAAHSAGIVARRLMGLA
jgi:uncharacterized protein (DUF2252 family)